MLTNIDSIYTVFCKVTTNLAIALFKKCNFDSCQTIETVILAIVTGVPVELLVIVVKLQT